MAPTRNHRYIFVSQIDGEIEVWADERSLPSCFSGKDIRRAKGSPNEMVVCGASAGGNNLGYMPVKGR